MLKLNTSTRQKQGHNKMKKYVGNQLIVASFLTLFHYQVAELQTTATEMAEIKVRHADDVGACAQAMMCG